jgi:hypothetical protein
MTVRELLRTLSDHAEDGRLLDDRIVIRVGSQMRDLDSTYVDGTLILVAGRPR